MNAIAENPYALSAPIVLAEQPVILAEAVDSPGEFKVCFNLEVDDRVDFIDFYLGEGLWWRGYWAAALIAASVATLAMALFDYEAGGAWHLYYGLMGVAMFTVAISPYRFQSVMRKNVAARAAAERAFGGHSVAVAPEQLTSCAPLCESQYHWSAIERVVRARRGVYLFTAPNSAVIVPRRAFDSEEELDYFHGLARRYQEAAARDGVEVQRA